ncbi:MAG TPA: hypothetical protein PLH72_00780 [Vicinamibacterales bacterium]|nr:hypothetical protein [Vicinamibacterales bacterium]
MAVTAATGAVQQLADSLMNRFDANNDGQLSKEEFSGLLGELMGSLKNSGSFNQGEGGGNVKFEGFDFGRAQDPQKSAKDAFAKIAREVGSMPLTKSEAETWFNTHVKGAFEELGHKVNWVEGDKFQFTNWQGTYTVDFVRGADGPDPAFWWGADPA